MVSRKFSRKSNDKWTVPRSQRLGSAPPRLRPRHRHPHHGRANGAAGAGGDDGLRGAKVAAEHHPSGSSDDLRWLRHYHRFLGKFCNLEAETVVQGDFEVWREQQHQHVA